MVPVAIRLGGLVDLWFVNNLGVGTALVVLAYRRSGRVAGDGGTCRSTEDSDVPVLSVTCAFCFAESLPSAPLITLSQVLLIGQSRIDWLIVAALTSLRKPCELCDSKQVSRV